MWILVLTIVTSHYSGGSSVATVNGFTSEAACMAAADAWIKQTQALADNYSYKRALCVKA